MGYAKPWGTQVIGEGTQESTILAKFLIWGFGSTERLRISNEGEPPLHDSKNLALLLKITVFHLPP